MAVNLIHNKWRIVRRIGGGSFGEIYMGVGPNNEKVTGILLIFQCIIQRTQIHLIFSPYLSIHRSLWNLKRKGLDVRSWGMNIKYIANLLIVMDFAR